MSRPSLTARLAQAANPGAGAIPVRDEPNGPALKPATLTPSGRRPVAEPPPSAPARGPAPARVGKTMIAGYFSAELARAVRVLAAERGVTIQALIGEGLDVVLRQAGKHPMGER